MDCEMDLGSPHLRQRGSFGLFPLRDRVTHDVAGRGLAMDGEDEFIYGITEVEQLQVGLEVEFRCAAEIAEVGSGEGGQVGSVEGFDVSPFEAGHVEEEFVAAGGELGIGVEPLLYLFT